MRDHALLGLPGDHFVVFETRATDEHVLDHALNVVERALTAGKNEIDVVVQSLTGDGGANGDVEAGNAGLVAALVQAMANGNVTANRAIAARFGIDAENFGSGAIWLSLPLIAWSDRCC
ncbi:hypothetical protein [Bradyrhizobium sp. RDM4]|uniref:hypothetical protein n=1 Tax=Bradyrhizobium sp. RDM4 TaxID=3378765 RepID=UPI0038FCE64E